MNSETNCTLQEIETFWSIDDVHRAIAILDMREYHSKKMSENNK